MTKTDLRYRLVTEIRRPHDGAITTSVGEPMTRELADAWLEHAKDSPEEGKTRHTRIEPVSDEGGDQG